MACFSFLFPVVVPKWGLDGASSSVAFGAQWLGVGEDEREILLELRLFSPHPPWPLCIHLCLSDPPFKPQYC